MCWQHREQRDSKRTSCLCWTPQCPLAIGQCSSAPILMSSVLCTKRIWRTISRSGPAVKGSVRISEGPTARTSWRNANPAKAFSKKAILIQERARKLCEAQELFLHGDQMLPIYFKACGPRHCDKVPSRHNSLVLLLREWVKYLPNRDFYQR